MRRVLSIVLAFLFAGLGTAVAENYPSRPMTIVVPFPAGGPTDALGRVLADRMKRALNQSVIVENVTGAAGTIGGRPCRTFSARWLHHDSRTLADLCRQWRDLHSFL